MENQFPLRLIKEEQESSEKLLELLVSSTHSPKGRFSKENSYIILKRKMKTTKKRKHSEIGIAFSSFFVDAWYQTSIHKRKSSVA